MSHYLIPTNHSRGFTIVETLIVLTISAGMFLVAIVLMASQQHRVEFHQAIGDIQTKVDQTISEVSTGYYPNGGNIVCTAIGPNLNIAIVGSGNGQGTNDGCIFLGKVLQFGNSGNRSAYVVHAVAGLDNNQGTLASVNPKAIDTDGSREIRQLRNGLEVSGMRYVDGGTKKNITAVAFVNGLGTYDSSNELESGTQQMGLVPVENSGTVPTATIPSTVSDINTQLKGSDSLLNPPNTGLQVQVCFHGGDNQYALMTLGGNGRSLSVTIDYRTDPCW